jgi:hypothetical protein
MTFRRAAFSLIALALIGCAIFVLISVAEIPLQPEYRTHVVVKSISYRSSKYNPPTASIRFRSEGGLESGISTPPANLKCKVGDTAPAIQQGVIIELTPGACRKTKLPDRSPTLRHAELVSGSISRLDACLPMDAEISSA